MNQEKQEVPRISENERALRFEYQFRRFGVVLLTFVIMAALAGVFSNGYFSAASKQNATATLRIHYQRFGRLMSAMDINIEVQKVTAQQLTISFGDTLLPRFQIGDIRPEPDKMYSRGGTLYLVYNQATPHLPLSLWLSVTPRQAGRMTNVVRINDRPPLSFSQFIYPQEGSWKWCSGP